MRNSTQTWGLSTDPDVLLTVPTNSFQTIPERYNQPPVSLFTKKPCSHKPAAEALLLNFNIGMHDWNRQQKTISLYALDNIQQTHGRRQKRKQVKLAFQMEEQLIILHFLLRALIGNLIYSA